MIASATGAAANTVGRGSAELEAGAEPDGRVRVRGAGRKPVTELDPGIVAALDLLVDPGRGAIRCRRCGGQPSRPRIWRLADGAAPVLGADGRQAADGDGVQPAREHQTIEGRQHPDRDQQFRYINEQVTASSSRRSSDLGGHEKEGADRQLHRRRRGGSAPASPARSCPTSPTRSSARSRPTACTT